MKKLQTKNLMVKHFVSEDKFIWKLFKKGDEVPKEFEDSVLKHGGELVEDSVKPESEEPEAETVCPLPESEEFENVEEHEVLEESEEPKKRGRKKKE